MNVLRDRIELVAGEIMITSVDKEGTVGGSNINLSRMITDNISSLIYNKIDCGY
jgi:imidazole glycerol phosphate synthase subunit HisF